MVIGGYFIDDYSIGGYWCLVMVIILMVIGGFLLMAILLVDIGVY